MMSREHPEKQPLRIFYLQHSQLENFLRTNQNHILALIDYSGIPSVALNAEFLSISLNMKQLSDPPLMEVWTSSLPLSTYQRNGFKIAYNEEIGCGYIRCEEFNGKGLEEVVYSAYNRILDSIPTLGFSDLFRIWNYFPAINGDRDGLERYQRFCMGRHQAFSEHYGEYKLALPAASAVGTLSGPFQLFFLAGRQKAIHIENPRQISAYDYPLMYGPKSPSFARATLTSISNSSYLFLGGTASIVGHATQHQDDPFKQTRETLANIESLVEHAKKANREVLDSSLSLSLLKIYIRYDQHIEIVKKAIDHYFGQHIPTLYLVGEMCRRNLLVEVEALYSIERNS